MRVLFVTPEAYPLIKTGGLADVAGALPDALRAQGADVRLLLPAYPKAVERAERKGKPISLGDPLGCGPTSLIPARLPNSDLRVWLLDCPSLFDRPGNPYLDDKGIDWPDNHLRFALLSRVSALICMAGNMLGWKPDILHCNDWQTGLAPLYLSQWSGPRTPSVFTVHNIQYQGLFDPSILPDIGVLPPFFALNGAEYHGRLSYLKAGLQFCDRITTVSPTYADEIQQAELGKGMEGILQNRASDLSGILNGVDYHLWDPALDDALVKRYSAARLGWKDQNKTALQKELGLPENDQVPLLGVVSRLTGQKGLDLVLDILAPLIEEGVQLAVLGAGDAEVEGAFKQAAAAYPENVGLYLGYDEALAHRLQAGCDMLLVPSRFEPCGLTQLYALRYGTLPVVRRTGGLADTVVDATGGVEGTGFVFDRADGADLLDAIRRALVLYGQKKNWRVVQKRAMAQDFSWQKAAESYLALYRELV